MKNHILLALSTCFAAELLINDIAFSQSAETLARFAADRAAQGLPTLSAETLARFAAERAAQGLPPLSAETLARLAASRAAEEAAKAPVPRVNTEVNQQSQSNQPNTQIPNTLPTGLINQPLSFNDRVNLSDDPNSPIIRVSDQIVNQNNINQSNDLVVNADGEIFLVAAANNSQQKGGNNDAANDANEILTDNQDEILATNFEGDLVKFVEAQIKAGNSSGSVTGVSTQTEFSATYKLIQNAFRESFVKSFFPNTEFRDLPNINRSSIASWRGWPGSGNGAPSSWDETTWKAFLKYVNTIPERDRLEILANNAIYNPINEGEWRREIATSFFKKTLLTDLPTSSSPLPWAGWPETVSAPNLRWADEAVWKQFQDYLNGLSPEDRAQVEENSRQNSATPYRVANLPDTSEGPPGGWGWQAQNDLWDLITDNGKLLPSGEFNFTFLSSVEGGNVQIGDTVIAQGAWGDHFRSLFDKDLGEADWHLRGYDIIIGEGPPGGTNDPARPFNYNYVDELSEPPKNGNADLLKWETINPNNTKPAGPLALGGNRNNFNRTVSSIFGAFIGPSGVALIPVLSGVVSNLLPGSAVAALPSTLVPPTPLTPQQFALGKTFPMGNLVKSRDVRGYLIQPEQPVPKVPQPLFHKVMW